MFFAISKLHFTDIHFDEKSMKSLSEKIRSHHKVSVRGGFIENEPILAIAALGDTEEQLIRTLDQISELIEASGYGRVSSEDSLIDDVRCIGSEDDEEDSDTDR